MKKNLVSANFSTKELCQSELISELIHRVSHEVGNPLTAVIALTSLIPIESDTGKIHEHAKSIKREAWKINALMERLTLLFSDKQGNEEPCCLEEAVHAAESKIRKRHGVNSLNLKINCKENGSFVSIDKDQLVSLLSELLLNAEQNVSNKNNVVTCTIEKDSANTAKLIISNLCDKACALELEDAFKPLVTSRETTKNLGLGLTIAHAIASRFSGTVSITEEEVAGGYLFSTVLSLPAG